MVIVHSNLVVFLYHIIIILSIGLSQVEFIYEV